MSKEDYSFECECREECGLIFEDADYFEAIDSDNVKGVFSEPLIIHVNCPNLSRGDYHIIKSTKKYILAYRL